MHNILRNIATLSAPSTSVFNVSVSLCLLFPSNKTSVDNVVGNWRPHREWAHLWENGWPPVVLMTTEWSMDSEWGSLPPPHDDSTRCGEGGSVPVRQWDTNMNTDVHAHVHNCQNAFTEILFPYPTYSKYVLKRSRPNYPKTVPE